MASISIFSTNEWNGMKLAELKAQNQAEEEARAEVQAEVEEEITQEPEEVLSDEIENIEEPESEEQTEVESEGEGESWMSSEDDAEHEERTVPLNALRATRDKLKGKLSEKDEVIEELKREVQALKQAPSTAQPPSIEAPRYGDFDTEEEFNEANAKYLQSLVQSTVTQTQQVSQQKQNESAQLEKMKSNVDAHYKRAQELVESTDNLSAELYQGADLAVREAIESIKPNQGDSLTDTLIARLGEGSEKVMYFLGRNETARNKLLSKLSADPTGLDAFLYLGELKSKHTMPAKQRSNAPAPATRVTGSNEKPSDKALKSKYDKAHSKRDIQSAYQIKKEAKKAGIDTTNW